jgi:hypothetical protein
MPLICQGGVERLQVRIYGGFFLSKVQPKQVCDLVLQLLKRCGGSFGLLNGRSDHPFTVVHSTLDFLKIKELSRCSQRYNYTHYV